jgi:aldehyde dehydrogenase (NAD+)
MATQIAPEIEEIFEEMSYGPAPESAAEALAWLDHVRDRRALFIGGRWVAPDSVARFESHNPATGDVLTELPLAGPVDVDRAVAAARAALGAWQELGGHGRARYLYALARAIQRHARLFAVLETLDNGKPIRESRDIDVPLVVRHFYHHAGWAQLAPREWPEREPWGVCGQIIPWNFPLLMLAWKVAPALAAGNTVVLKPAEYTSLTALLFAEVCQEVGLPPGVVEIVTGDGSTGELIVGHDGIDKLAFTGSTEVGGAIQAKLAGTGKGLTLELGGKSPFVVFEDADLDSAIEGLVDSIWLNQGQVCCAGSRLLVQEGIEQALLDRIEARLATLRIGDPLDKSTDVGAIVDARQLKRITALVELGLREGARLRQPSHTLPATGWFYPPTLLSDVEPSNPAAIEEIFGPVLVAMSFRTPDEAVTLANHTRYGLAATVFSQNLDLALDMAKRIEAGVVWVNCANQFDAAAPFGGYKESGFGREGGAEGMLAYLKPRLPTVASKTGVRAARRAKAKPPAAVSAGAVMIDRTAKLYIGGKQVRPDSGYSLAVHGHDGRLLEPVGRGNRKDVRNAVEAGAKATSWTGMSGHGRAQVLYFVAENLSARAAEFADRLEALAGVGTKQATAEVEASIARLFTYAAWADKYDGRVHAGPSRTMLVAIHEAIGQLAIVCPDRAPLLSLVSLAAPALALGNRVTVVPSERHPLIATDLYQVLETSDLPGGALNVVTGLRNELLPTLAGHGAIRALWCFADAGDRAPLAAACADNLKQTWFEDGEAIDWASPAAEGTTFLERAVQVKTIWLPHGA